MTLGLTGITRQGLYEDEAAGCRAALWLRHGVTQPGADPPWMAASYAASVTGVLYGAWLRVSGREFEVASWRLCGLVLVASGLASWPLLTASSLGLGAQAAFLALFVTDSAALLFARNMNAMSFSLLLGFGIAAFWLHGINSRRAAGGLGLLVGFCVFDKLTNLALLPVCAALLAPPRSRRHWGWAAGGFLLGVSPLLATNLYALARSGRATSLAPILSNYPAYSLAGFLGRAASLGSGALPAEFILGMAITPARVLAAAAEGGLLLILLSYIGLDATRKRRLTPAAALATAYALVLTVLFCLPRPTWAHHWLIATPLQYAALAAALGVVRPRRWLVTGITLLLLIRIPGLWDIESALARGQSAARWHPSLTKYARFAADHRDALFLSATWGVQNAAACLSQEDGHVVSLQPLRIGRAELERLIAARRPRMLYVAAKGFATGSSRGDPAPVLALCKSLPQWRPTPLEPEARRWPAVSLWKFEPRPPGSRVSRQSLENGL